MSFVPGTEPPPSHLRAPLEPGLVPPEDSAMVRFGRRPHGRTNESDHWNFLKAPANNPQGRWNEGGMAQSTRTTKFGNGFARKNVTLIGHDRERKSQEQHVETRRQRHAPKRTELLRRLDSGYNAFNIITGEQEPSMERNVRKQMRHCDESKSKQLMHEGHISLRDSTRRPSLLGG